MRLFLAIVACVVLTACAGHQQFYKAYSDARTLPDVQLLEEGQEPRIVRSDDMRRDIDIALSRGYRAVGESSFNGQMESEQSVARQAKAVGASFVLLATKFTGSQTVTTPLILPNNQTTYSSGMVGGSSYAGSSTSYGSTVVPLVSQQQRYDQYALYFVKSTAKPKFGAYYNNLTPELRARYERNTGVLIKVVVEDSPSFLANILPGDIVIEFNGAAVTGPARLTELLDAAPVGSKCTLKIIRNGAEKLIELQLG